MGDSTPPPARSNARLQAWLGDLARLQQPRLALWCAPAMMAGAAVWMAAARTPPIWLLAVGFLLAAAFAAAAGRAPNRLPRPGLDGLRRWSARVALLAAFFCAGGLAGEARTRLAEAPRLAAPLGPTVVTGWVAAVEPGAARPRMKIRVAGIEGLAEAPRYVRVSAPSVLTPGRPVRCRAVLAPPDPPLTPTGFDAQRRGYFEQVGGQGFALGHCRVWREAPDPGALTGFGSRLGAWRRDLAEAVTAAAPGQGGTTAAALITGDRSLMSAETRDALQDSGLGHLLSVSGLHMSLVAGMVFFALARGLALIGPLALRVPVRKLAAAGALAACAAYLAISGASVPAVRAYVMTAVALGAVLMDRPALTMRALATAGILVTALTPEAVLEPGFQMSFAATAALIAVFEHRLGPGRAPALPTPGPIVGTLQGVWGGVRGAIAASLVAGLATDVFAIHHFQRQTLYGLPANLVASPITAFLVAPAAGLAAALAPFGLAEGPLRAMAWGLDLLIGIGQAFSGRPEAVQALPMSSPWTLILACGALLWACLWRGALRAGAVLFAAGAVWAYGQAPRPVLLAAADLSVVVAHTQEGWRLMAPGGPPRAFLRDRLTAAAGLNKAPPLHAACTAQACAWRSPQGAAFALSPGGLRLTPPSGPPAEIRSDAAAGGLLVFPAGPRAWRAAAARPEGYDRPWSPARL